MKGRAPKKPLILPLVGVQLLSNAEGQIKKYPSGMQDTPSLLNLGKNIFQYHTKSITVKAFQGV